ncbi:hypothetical protein [Marivita geojedonensis]|nr:hypothetical protein [Marivita geojedonensis]
MSKTNNEGLAGLGAAINHVQDSLSLSTRVPLASFISIFAIEES